MNETEIKWYSLNLDQKVEEHEPIDLGRAAKIADQYLVRGNEKFKDDREAIAATMFGFSKSKSNFIEICINGPKQISYKFEFSNPEASWFQKFRNATFRHEDELHSRDELIQKITDFFSYSSERLVQIYKNKGISTTSGRSPLGNRPNTSAGYQIFTIILAFSIGVFFLIAFCEEFMSVKFGGQQDDIVLIPDIGYIETNTLMPFGFGFLFTA